MRLHCPHCGGLATIRSSKELATTVREASVQCNDVECAHTWVTRIIADRTIAPSMKPNPKVYIPLSPRSPSIAPAADKQLELGMAHPPPRLATG